MVSWIDKMKNTDITTVFLTAVVFFFSLAIASWDAYATETKQTTFSSPHKAVQAMVAAIESDNISELLKIFGPESKDLFYSGDAEQDAERLDRFLGFYAEKHRIEVLSADRTILHIGMDDWSMPVPIVKVGSRWRFATEEGIQEILARRIGRNELAAIQVCLAYVDAQLEYAERHSAMGLMEYAQKLASTSDKKDGLCWKNKKGEMPSPMGPQIVDASKDALAGGKAVPYHGYLYRILKMQGENAPGGAYAYVVDGRMVGGFALLAYPAGYGVSGIMTFIVNHDGIVYQKDLGRGTDKIAEKMAFFDPDSTWEAIDQR